jgi:serine/threonine protein kinase
MAASKHQLSRTVICVLFVLLLLPPPGSGEFGEVYKAKWHGSYVAAKVLKRSDEITLGDFRTEIAILRKIHHPNCVQVRAADALEK